MEKLIFIYREKELYSIFYSSDKKKFIKVPHKKTNSWLYIIVFIVLLNGSQFAANLYKEISNGYVNLISIMISIMLSYLIAKVFYNNYYEISEQRVMEATVLDVSELFVKGRKQNKIYTILIIITDIMMLLCTTLFFMFGSFLILIIVLLLFIIMWIGMFMHPYARKKIQKIYKRKEDLE
ncbi:Uncharacterised protein [Listeria grayi]|uniref:hypothetical protein n=1 Tax=Listeria grayi TaxID=1641 RepID=UPI000F7134B4|nr:hypothetical protein [Listeria grayi]VEI31864.1 Uncharacterised protein [Listeria grayi]